MRPTRAYFLLLFLAFFTFLSSKVIFDARVFAKKQTTNPDGSTTTTSPDGKGGATETTTSKGREGRTITREVQKDRDGRPTRAAEKREDNSYKFERVPSAGLSTVVITTPFGKILINLPDALFPGDTFTATVQTEPTGRNEAERINNQTELNGMIIEIDQQKTTVAEKSLTYTIPADFTGAAQLFSLEHKGTVVVNTSIPIPNARPPAHASNAQLPTCGQIGRNVVIRDHCDGIIAATDSCLIGDVPLQPLAESPRMRVLLNTNQAPGSTQIKYTEQRREATGPFQNLGVSITSPNTNLLRNQETQMQVVALVEGIQQDVSLNVVNKTPSIVSISGGDNQYFVIHPNDVQQDGTYRQTFTVKANQAGAWGTTATVSCIEASSSGPVGDSQPTASPRSAIPRIGVTPSPTPTPTPGAHPPPSPTPSPSSSPCAPTPTPTTYAVKDMGALPTLDSSSPHCMATGVNDDGNVVGACLGKYKGGPPSGSWRAFRTDAGGAVIKAKDDLGFPAGAIGGVSFAMAVNKDGHVAGYWADAPTGGTDLKGFWYDGSKMINLHPSTFPLKVSEAYALNKSDDVVGTAWTLFSDKHAVIWPAGVHAMTDLNDYMDPASKKDWKLLQAYAINDAGEIVGRAEHLKKLHAFLLKGKGLAPIDLGALTEFKDDSSAAYSLNACDQVVGYTYTLSGHHGFLWKAESGMKDMGTLSPPYTFSYAQAINKNGEIVGTVSKTFHHSAFFEGIGFAIGSDPSGVAYSHAVWYNGIELKDLNGAIPGFAAWEINLANGINNKGQIAGSGFFKGPGYSKGSLITKAVLLTPGGLTSPPIPPTAASCPLALGKGYIFDNWNICGVKNGPTKDTTFTIDAPSLITFIATYHWNDGLGALPGSKGISLKDSSGKIFGPWSVTTSAGSGGKANVNWECHPGITLPAGTYTIINPDPATWSQNGASGNSGFGRVAGSPKK